MNLLLQRRDLSVFMCDVNGTVIAHFPNIINTKNQRSLLKAVRVVLKTWIDQLDKEKNKTTTLQSVEEADELDNTTDLKDDIVKEQNNEPAGVAKED